MNANVLDRNYGTLTPEERFRLILAASGRGDEAEGGRLARAGRRITLSVQDHSPYAHAFNELAFLTFIELVEDAVRYHEACLCLGAADFGDEGEEDEIDDTEVEDEAAIQAVLDKAKRGFAVSPVGNRRPWQRLLELAYAAGFVLRTKADGWKLFCERLHVPPLLVWQELPGFERLQEALAQTEKTAFNTEGILRWLNTVRPASEPAMTEIHLTVVGVADDTEHVFKQRVAWWGG